MVSQSHLCVGALLTLGIALCAGTAPFFLVWVCMGLILQFIHIPFEESQLEKVFGKTYLDYKTKVRRWV